MAVRTKQLANDKVTSGGSANVVYTAPAGRTAIVKDIVLDNTGSTAVVASLFVQNTGHTAACDIVAGSVLGGSQMTSTGRFVVLEPLDELWVYASSIATGDVKVLVSGTELDGVA